MLGENRYTPNPTNPDPFAPSLAPFPDPKNHMDNDERSSVSDNDETAPAVGEKPVPAPGKKTRGRVRIQMEYIQNKLRRYTTFSKRKSGMMKKAYELSTLTGTQVMLLVASETGHVYTFATPKLQPMITSDAGKALIQTCLHQPDPTPMNHQGPHQGDFDVRMSSTGYEETDLGYSGLSEEDTFKNGMEMHISNSVAMPTIMNPGPIVTIPHGIMQMPFPVSLAESGAPVMTTQPMMHHVHTLTSTPQTMSPHTSPPPSYSPPHQPSSPPRTYTPVSYPGSPPTQGPAYSQASVPPHVSHQVMSMEELGSPGHLHHAMDPYERSPSRSPIHSRYSPHIQQSPRTLYAAPNGSPPMPRI